MMTRSMWRLMCWLCMIGAVIMGLVFFWQWIKLNVIILLLGSTCIYLSYRLLLRKG